MFLKRKTMFDVIREADDEEQSQEDANTDQETADAPDESGEDTDGDDAGEDEDFDIDTNLDDADGGEDGGGDESGGEDTDTSSDVGSSEGDEEPVQANTDVFSSLSAEEQQIKIMELKRLYQDLYTSTDDILEKINSTDSNERNLEIINRVSTALYTLRKYIADYITKSFPFKSYIENDITFNRFLAILNSISVVIDDLGNEIEKLDKK